jgi:type IV pilus assembly protein PilW
MSRRKRQPSIVAACSLRGSGLIELLIAMALALLLIGAAVAAIVKGRDAQTAAEATAQLQETARYALGIIGSDLRMSGYLGLHRHGAVIANLDGSLTDPDGGDVPFDGCGPLWTTNLDEPVSGWDQTGGRFGLGPGCPANGAWRATTDGLILRRASSDRIPQTAAGLRAYARHILLVTGHASGLVFVGDAAGTIPAGYASFDPLGRTVPGDTRRLLVHAYYISSGSSEGARVPSLRRKRLVAGPAVQDEEIIPGVEDLQVQYGVDGDNDGSADRWLDADEVAGGTSVVAARIWLRVRSRERDPAWNDATRYAYANQDENLPLDERPYRRLVVMKTIQLRNSATP